MPRSTGKRHVGRIKTIDLNDLDMERKKKLIFEYKSQVPMLFGGSPDNTLRECRNAFATEVLIEVSRR